MISISSDAVFIQYNGPVYPGLARVLGSRNRFITALSTHIAHNGQPSTNGVSGSNTDQKYRTNAINPPWRTPSSSYQPRCD